MEKTILNALCQKNYFDVIKPFYIYAYILFKGDQNKIFEFANNDFNVSPVEVNLALSGIDFKNYCIYLEGERFLKYCKIKNLNPLSNLVIKIK